MTTERTEVSRLQEQVNRLKQIVQEQHEAIKTLAEWATYGVDPDTDRALDYANPTGEQT